MNFNVGLSLYLSNDFKFNEEIIKKAIDIKSRYIFTSLHIPEETFDIDKVKDLFMKCAENSINLICDISPNTLKKFDFQSFSELKKYGINYLRLDFGFDLNEIVKLSEDFIIVINSSTFNEEEYYSLKKLGMNFDNMVAVHNYYPKKDSGLSINKVKKINDKLHSYGIKVFGFVMGDKTYRGPLFEGLPTIEDQRNTDVLYNILELKKETDMDVVLVGDMECSREVYQNIKDLNEGFISIKCDIEIEFKYLLNVVHHDRVDNSDRVIRSFESRTTLVNKNIKPNNKIHRNMGSLTVSNNDYLRYVGEFEICKMDLEDEARINNVGKVKDDYIRYLKFIENGFGYKLKE